MKVYRIYQTKPPFLPRSPPLSRSLFLTSLSPRRSPLVPSLLSLSLSHSLLFPNTTAAPAYPPPCSLHALQLRSIHDYKLIPPFFFFPGG